MIQCTCVFTGYCTNLDEYLKRLSKPTTFRPHGELLHVYQHQDQTYEVYKVHVREMSVLHHLTLTYIMMCGWTFHCSAFQHINISP